MSDLIATYTSETAGCVFSLLFNLLKKIMQLIHVENYQFEILRKLST